jgi:hypothetical protein
MEIIKLKEPWAFYADEDYITQGELEELQKHFTEDIDNVNSWETDRYCGVNWEGDHCMLLSFDEDDEDNITVYTVEELREIIAKHKEPQLEEGVVYYVEDKNFGSREWFVKYGVDGFIDDEDRYFHTYAFKHDLEGYIYTKATPAQIKHYEACVKAGKYVEPEGYEDKAPQPTRSERYIKTMQFFEQLREPERSEAIANYDEDWSDSTPKDLATALDCGFEWSATEQKHLYWSEIKDNIKNNTYFKEPEFLVFGKYKVGDIIVSLEHVLASRAEGVKQSIHASDLVREGIYDAWAQKQSDAVMAGEYVHKMQDLTIQGAKNLDKLHLGQQNTPDYSHLYSGEMTKEEFDEIKRLSEQQQDELVIYKPKRLIL